MPTCPSCENAKLQLVREPHTSTLKAWYYSRHYFCPSCKLMFGRKTLNRDRYTKTALRFGSVAFVIGLVSLLALDFNGVTTPDNANTGQVYKDRVDSNLGEMVEPYLNQQYGFEDDLKESRDSKDSRISQDARETTEVGDVELLVGAANFVQNWRRSWERKDLDSYFSHYSAALFVLDDDLTYEEWQQKRRAVIARARDLRIELTDIEVNQRDARSIIVRFSQEYNAHNYSDQVLKELELSVDNGSMAIVKEQMIEQPRKLAQSH